MKKIYSLVLTAFISLTAAAQPFVKWDFDASNMTPSLDNTSGSASISLFNTTSSYATGNPGFALNTTGYPSQGTNSGTEGLQFGVSTFGRTGIIFGLDLRLSATASKYLQFHYTTDGTNWNVVDLTNSNATGPVGAVDIVNDVISIPVSTIWYSFTVDLTGVPAVNNNPDFAIRVVSVFAPGTSAYAPVESASTYGTAGTVRFDNITIGQNSTLPIRLSYFSAIVNKNNAVQLNWETASEENFSHFIIERSTDGVAYANIGTRLASQQGNGAVYSYTDDYPYEGTLYYRLKIVNKDNSFEYSNTARVDMQPAFSDAFTISPNPANENISIEFSKLEKGTLTVYDLSGRIIASHPLDGTSKVKALDLQTLNPGCYIISLFTGYNTAQQRFVKY